MSANRENSYYYEDDWMDSPLTKDASLTDSSLRLSARKLGPEERDKPVLICAHGFSASTYEWEELRHYAEKNGVLVSSVLMGGHGRSVYEFEKSTWRQWGQPVLEEYHALASQGYTCLNLIGSSTGGTLILYYLLQGEYTGCSAPRNVILIDPFLSSRDKLLYLAPLFKFFIKNITNPHFSPEERRHWYVNRPVGTLLQLRSLLGEVRKQLRHPLRLEEATRLRVYRAREDNVAHPRGIYRLMRMVSEADGNKPLLKELDSRRHVFLRGQGRKVWGEKDRALQQKIMTEIVSLLKSSVQPPR